MDPCRLKFQVIWTLGSRVIAVRSWPENIGNFCLLYLQLMITMIAVMMTMLIVMITIITMMLTMITLIITMKLEP